VNASTEPPSLTVGTDGPIVVVGADEQADVEVDVDRWCRLATAVLRDAGRHGELTLTFVDRDEIAVLNGQHLGEPGPTDVLSFPLDDGDDKAATGDPVPVLLGDVVICPDVARTQAPTHAGTFDDELALLVVHGVLHILGDDHAEADEATAMRSKEIELLIAHHWGGPAPAAFRQAQE
jgi:probable rRNA maturation factor